MVAVFALSAAAGSSSGCSSNNKPACDMPGGPVSGAADTHCGSTVVSVDQNACAPPPDAGPGDPDASPQTGNDYGPTMYGTEADDDDCKYHVTWSVSDVCENHDITFHTHVTNKDDGSPAVGGMPYIEAYINNHPAPNSGAGFVDKGGGDYDIGPMRFDQPGRWTVRFHYFSLCVDSETSPHGHAAFFLDVP